MLEREGSGRTLCKIFSSGFEPASHHHPAGRIITDGKKEMKVAVKDGFLNIYNLQQEGKRRMETGNFLAGINLISSQPRFS